MQFSYRVTFRTSQVAPVLFLLLLSMLGRRKLRECQAEHALKAYFPFPAALHSTRLVPSFSGLIRAAQECCNSQVSSSYPPAPTSSCQLGGR